MLGLTFGRTDRDRLEQALHRRLVAARRPQAVTGYLDDLEAGESFTRAETTALAAELTVGETYFLRHAEQFSVLTSIVLPDRLRRTDRPALPAPDAALGRPLPPRLLSAGCSGGEEAYSLAITMAESGYHNAQITAIDVNPKALAKARAGRYTSWSMRAVSQPVQNRWFTADGDQFVLAPQLRGTVDFRQRNLRAPDPDFWRPGFDVIFCRNVLMYFAPRTMAEVVRRLASALLPGGYLFLGSAETLRGVSDEFDLCQSEGTFYYRLASPPPVPEPEPLRRAEPITLQMVAASSGVPHPRPAGDGDHDSFGRVLDLVQAEQFGAALSAVELIHVPTSPPSTTWQTEVMLVRAVLLAHAGDLTAATRDAHRLLGLGTPVSADAHAVLATCRESDADTRGALLHWRAAAAADPGFAIAQLHLGRLSRYAGDLAGAGHAYDLAIGLLRDETDRRIMLFGGGFDRDALLSVCRSMSHGGQE